MFIALTKKSDEEIPPLFKKYIRLILILYGAVVILVFVNFIVFLAGYLGQKSADRQYDEFKNSKELSITIIHKDKTEWKGYSIICSETHCAFLVDEQVKVWPLSDISVIESKPKGNMRNHSAIGEATSR